MEAEGMTDFQFKGILIDQLYRWRQVKKYAEEEHAVKTASFAQDMIDLTERILRL